MIWCKMSLMGLCVCALGLQLVLGCGSFMEMEEYITEGGPWGFLVVLCLLTIQLLCVCAHVYVWRVHVCACKHMPETHWTNSLLFYLCLPFCHRNLGQSKCHCFLVSCFWRFKLTSSYLRGNGYFISECLFSPTLYFHTANTEPTAASCYCHCAALPGWIRFQELEGKKPTLPSLNCFLSSTLSE